MMTPVESFMQEELDRTGKRIDPENFFQLRGRMWDPKDQDYTLDIQAESVLGKYRDFADALQRFNKLRYQDLPGHLEGDVDLELLHLRFGVPHVVKSRILFPG